MLHPVCTKHLQSVCRARALRPVEQVLNAGPALRSRLGAKQDCWDSLSICTWQAIVTPAAGMELQSASLGFTDKLVKA